MSAYCECAACFFRLVGFWAADSQDRKQNRQAPPIQQKGRHPSVRPSRFASITRLRCGAVFFDRISRRSARISRKVAVILAQRRHVPIRGRFESLRCWIQPCGVQHPTQGSTITAKASPDKLSPPSLLETRQ
ncbi:hypothetical protein ebA4791 [Aromatoleum aromaticum EbN1]|uniref:Uncharacterized protein n=1 Tax=Aromatoleum aromaticum (strain DSM 19018 / LMG 30748 / EbN1) TaxID=76114 RepID=Q5P1H9_AROAE|nr:hypothetical protein ebA4791 [Aromatoleum aromaticum EbN1]